MNHSTGPKQASRATVTVPGGQISYLHSGPADGPLVVLVHGWPATAITWTPQIEALAAAGFHVIAPDMRGYGQSMVPTERSAYAIRHLVADLLALLGSVGRSSATWIGHDWGASTVWALAAHHPELCDGVSGWVVPYRSLERGWTASLDYVNRDVYPAEEFPNAQLDYMAFYEQAPDRVVGQFETAPDRAVRAVYRSGDPVRSAGPSAHAFVTRNGGWFGGAAMPPDLPRDPAVLTEQMYDELVHTLTVNGFWGPACYYLNREDNLRYSNESVDDGFLRMPALFVEAQFDTAADTARSRTAEPMRQYCADLSEASFAAGHWVGLEKADEVNDALLNWLSSPSRSN